jgi:putative membrane protein
MRRFLLRWMVNFFGLWTAATLVTGISYQEHVRVLIWAALIFSIVNALIKPLIILLTLPAIVLTLGLFTFVINAAMLYLVTFFYSKFEIHSFGAALLAVIIIWIVNWLLNDLLEPRKHETNL